MLSVPSTGATEREFFIDNLLVRIHFIVEMIWWTGLAPWEFELVPHLHLFLFLFARNTPACVRVDTLIPASTQFLKTVGRYRIPDALPFAD